MPGEVQVVSGHATAVTVNGPAIINYIANQGDEPGTASTAQKLRDVEAAAAATVRCFRQIGEADAHAEAAANTQQCGGGRT